MNELVFFKPNELIAAIDQIHVSRLAKLLCNHFLKYAQEQIKFNNYEGTKFEVSVSQINGLAEIQAQDYKRLKNSLLKLIQPVILRDDPQGFSALAPITSINIDVPKGLYKFELHSTVVDLLRNTDYFTKLDLPTLNHLQGKHSLVIYEWLKRYEHAPKIPQITVEELRKITDTQSKSYDNFTNLKDRVIDVAVTEITEQTQYTVSYTTIKERTTRRPRVSAIQFEFKQKELSKEDTDVQKDATSEIERISLAEAISDARDVLNKHFRSDDSYRIQCSYFLNAFLCTEEEYYRATQLINYRALSWWLENKKTTNLKYFISDVKAGQRKGRFKDRIEFYKTLLGHLRPEQQELFKEAESRLGFKSLLERILELLNDNRKLDDSWL